MFINLQEPAPRVEGLGLNIHSIFYTIQGEGPFAGRPSVFVRLYGCNLQCPHCDTDYTSVNNVHSNMAVLAGRIVGEYQAHGQPLIVITGGEPFRQDISGLVEALHDIGCVVQVETNGSYAPRLPDEYTVIVCSPKTGKVHKKLLPYISAYKYVVQADQMSSIDGLPISALGHPAHPVLARPPEGFPRESIYVQPVDPDPDGANLAACIESCYTFGYTLCLQQHKIIGVP